MILDSYFLSAVFWIELLVTISLIFDIKWISNSIPYNNGLSVYENLHVIIYNFTNIYFIVL